MTTTMLEFLQLGAHIKHIISVCQVSSAMNASTEEIVASLATVAARVQNLEHSLNLPMAQDAKTRADISAALLQARRITRSLEEALQALNPGAV
jgi:hypothetical protein